MTKPTYGKQRTVKGAYSPDFKESLGGDDNFYPGPTPNKYSSKSSGTPLDIDERAIEGTIGGPQPAKIIPGLSAPLKKK